MKPRRTIGIVFAVTLALFCSSPPAAAFDVSLLFGWMSLQDIETEGNLPVFGVGVGHFFGNIGVEGGFEYAPNAGFEFDRPGIGDFNTSMANLYGNVIFAWFFNVLEPYATAGFGLNITRANGIVLDDPIDIVDRSTAFNYGVGTYVNLKTFLLRFDYRRFAVHSDAGDLDFELPFSDLKITTRADLSRWLVGVVLTF